MKLELSAKQIKFAAPSVYADTHAMSNRYNLINTGELLEAMHDSGFVPVDAKQDRAARRDPDTQIHHVTLRHQSYMSQTGVGDRIPEIHLVNSHNGRTKFRMFAGFYRLVCSNGLVVGRDVFRHEIRHVGVPAEEAIRCAIDMTDQLGLIAEQLSSWSRLELNSTEQVAFARDAAELRWGATAEQYKPSDLLAARRDEDKGDDLWRVFNRVQEATTKGGLKGMSATNRVVSTRPITQIERNISFNRDLWTLAEEYAAAA